MTSIGTRRDFDDREPASESEGGSGVTLVVYSTVGWVGCIIVIVSFQLSLSPYALLLRGPSGPASTSASRLLDHSLPLSADVSPAENLPLRKLLSLPLNCKRSLQSILTCTC